MPEVKVSVIIPAYNAEKYIKETILSVKNQSFSAWEILVINDGSEDKTEELMEEYLTDNIQLVNQVNAGVASARNKGIGLAAGEYLVFLDADDILTPEFMSIRVQAMDEDPELGFVGGIIETFPRKSRLAKASAKNPEKEILFFDQEYSTVPSNYMIRKSVLDDHNLCFNTGLSSTADRFFVLQLSKYTKGLCIEADKGKLLYRTTDQSMSHNIGPALLADNENFFYEVLRANLLPVKDRQSFKALYFFSLASGFVKIHKIKKGLKYFSKSFLASPLKFLPLFFKKVAHLLRDSKILYKILLCIVF